MTSPWASLLADALVGTERRSGVDPAQLLDRSSAWASFRRAGTPIPRIDDAAPEPAGPETRALIGDAAAQRLERLLGGIGEFDAGTHESLLHEWLELVRDHDQRVPPELLPALLDAGRPRAPLRPLIADAGGARARWLAEQNPEWTYLDREADRAATDLRDWDTGGHAQRVGYLRAERRRDPAQARARLAGEWAALPPAERADLLGTLAVGLGPDDEPLLESALDDRRKEVRAIAADLLTVLPGSAYQVRAADRARQHLVLTATGVEVRLPEAYDKAMRRDGIAPKPLAGTGERAWWLEEVLARAPLSAWPVAPATLLDRVRGDEWEWTVYRGLGRAAATQRDPAAAAAVLDSLGADESSREQAPGPTRDRAREQSRDRALAADLYPVLEPEQLQRRAAAALAGGKTAAWGPLLAHCPRPWPDGLTELVLDGLSVLARRREFPGELASRVPHLGGELHQLARLAAVRLPVSAAAAARALAESLRDAENVDTLPFEVLAETLTFRHEMTMEIA